MISTIVPITAAVIIIYALIKKVDVYNSFITGAKRSFSVVIRVMPYMAAMLIVIELLHSSGLIDIIIKLLEKPLSFLGIPPELMPLALLRPLSGSASVAMVTDIIKTYGVDSFIAVTAATMMGSSETILYTLSLYFGSIGIKKTRFTLPVALISSTVSVMASIMICKLIFKY